MAVPTGDSLARQHKIAIGVFVVLVSIHSFIFVTVHSWINIIGGEIEVTAVRDGHRCLVGDFIVIVILLFQ